MKWFMLTFRNENKQLNVLPTKWRQWIVLIGPDVKERTEMRKAN